MLVDTTVHSGFGSYTGYQWNYYYYQWINSTQRYLLLSYYKPIRYQIMMYIFDHHYDVEMKELIAPEYNMNKIIDGQIIYISKKIII